MSETVFLTNGVKFIGPYLPGEIAISRGKRMLAEDDGGPYEVHAVRAGTLEEAKRAWSQSPERKTVR